MEDSEPIVNKPKGYLMLHNIGKRNNLGTVIRSASAFNFEKVFLISKEGNGLLEENKPIKESEGESGAPEGEEVVVRRKRMIRQAIKQFQMFGDHGTKQQMEFDVFKNLKEAKEFFVANKISVCGVEITADSKSVVTHPFRGDTVFLLGNEGQGLIDAHKKICDHFVYIPQYTNKTASLNVSCAATIVFHHFAVWACYTESPIFGEKFQDQSAIEPQQDADATEKQEQGEIKEAEEVKGSQIEGKLVESVQKQEDSNTEAATKVEEGNSSEAKSQE